MARVIVGRALVDVYNNDNNNRISRGSSKIRQSFSSSRFGPIASLKTPNIVRCKRVCGKIKRSRNRDYLAPIPQNRRRPNRDRYLSSSGFCKGRGP